MSEAAHPDREAGPCFMMDDADGGRRDIGRVRFVKERLSEPTSSNGRPHPTQRCVLFDAERELGMFGKSYRYIVCICHSDLPIADYAPGQRTDSKEVSGFPDLSGAEEAYLAYGPEYLRGDRLVWCGIVRVDEGDVE